MNNIDTSVLVATIVADLSIELSTQPTFSPEVLESKVKNAINEVMLKRNYKATKYNEEQILDDLCRYYPVIRNVALYDFAQIGAPFEDSHNENSTSRSWVKRESLFASVVAFVDVL